MRAHTLLRASLLAWFIGCAQAGPYGSAISMASRCEDFCTQIVTCNPAWAVSWGKPPCSWTISTDLVQDDCQNTCENLADDSSDTSALSDYLDCEAAALESDCNSLDCQVEYDAAQNDLNNFSLPARDTLTCAAVACVDTCAGPNGEVWTADGSCDDGGVGSVNGACGCGTDCTDCGRRDNC
jgi:hypothetical protein